MQNQHKRTVIVEGCVSAVGLAIVIGGLWALSGTAGPYHPDVVIADQPY